MERRPRVAIAGASGIGKHHAKWHHQVGANVVAFLGTTATSCRATAVELQELFPFKGESFVEWGALLAAVRPDAVDICAPNYMHFDLTMAALEAGCHVLCEKPLVWGSARSGEEQLAHAKAMVAKSVECDRMLGICTQYAVALEHYLALYEPARGKLGRIEAFDVEMETLSRGRTRSPAQIWVDMGPHPLSLLLAWLPRGHIEPETLTTSFAASEARVEFVYAAPAGDCRCSVAVRDRDEGAPVRRFGVNGVVVDCGGCAGPDGTYRSLLSLDDTQYVDTDFMHRLIQQFDTTCLRDGVPPVSGDTGLRNLELLVQIMQKAEVLD